MEETKKKLYVEPDGFWTEAAILFMALAIVFRLIGSIGRWEDLHYLITMVALPVFSGLLFLLCLLFFSKRAFWTTVIPVVFDVVFVIFLAMRVESEWIKVGMIAACVVIVVFYTMTFSHPKLKWVLALILLAIFAGLVVLKDLPVLMDLEHPVSFVDGMQEMSLLGIVLSLLCVSLAMKMGAKTSGKPAEPVEEPQPAPAPVEEPVEAEATPENKPAKEKRRGWGKKPAKEPAPAPEDKPAVEPEPAGEMPPAEIWSAQPAPVPAWEPPAGESEAEETQTPVETVILPENPRPAEPARVFPLEEPENGRNGLPADDGGPNEA